MRLMEFMFPEPKIDSRTHAKAARSFKEHIDALNSETKQLKTVERSPPKAVFQSQIPIKK